MHIECSEGVPAFHLQVRRCETRTYSVTTNELPRSTLKFAQWEACPRGLPRLHSEHSCASRGICPLCAPVTCDDTWGILYARLFSELFIHKHVGPSLRSGVSPVLLSRRRLTSYGPLSLGRRPQQFRPPHQKGQERGIHLAAAEPNTSTRPQRSPCRGLAVPTFLLPLSWRSAAQAPPITGAFIGSVLSVSTRRSLL